VNEVWFEPGGWRQEDRATVTDRFRHRLHPVFYAKRIVGARDQLPDAG
jgi:hypothetical protein